MHLTKQNPEQSIFNSSNLHKSNWVSSVKKSVMRARRNIPFFIMGLIGPSLVLCPYSKPNKKILVLDQLPPF
jgi:hypothetical protein